MGKAGKTMPKLPTSGIVPRMKPTAPPMMGTPGLGATRHQLKTARMDSLPKAKSGKKAC